MPQLSLGGTVTYAPECVFCDLKVDNVATEEYKAYLTRTAKKGAHPEDPRTDSGRIVVRCPVCELEFISTAFGLSDESVKELEDEWIKDGFSEEVSP